jgi:hypothetical protein
MIAKKHTVLIGIIIGVSLLIIAMLQYPGGSGDYTFLPIMQKVKFICIIILILLLDYFTHEKDFEHIIQAKKQIKNEA